MEQKDEWIGGMTVEEVHRLLVEARKMRDALYQLMTTDDPTVRHEFVAACFAHDVEMAALPPGKAHWEIATDDVLRQFAAGEITEGIAAYYLGVDRVEARVMASQFAAEQTIISTSCCDGSCGREDCAICKPDTVRGWGDEGD